MALDPPSTPSRRRRWVPFAVVGLGSAAAVGVLASIDPNEPGHYPTCPLLAGTGVFCPGCGALRTVHALAQGDVLTALERNPLAVVLLPLVVVAWVLWGLRLAGLTRWSPTYVPGRWVWGLLGVVLVYWIARNVPGWTWLSPL